MHSDSMVLWGNWQRMKELKFFYLLHILDWNLFTEILSISRFSAKEKFFFISNFYCRSVEFPNDNGYWTKARADQLWV